MDGGQAPPTRGGGGLIAPTRADSPLIAPQPASLSFGLVRPGASVPVEVTVADAGSGSGQWEVAMETVDAAQGASLALPTTVLVPGTLRVTASVDPGAADADFSGFIRLTRGLEVRRIPFWLHVSRPALSDAKPARLRRPGITSGNTSGKPSRVARYRYPDVPASGPVSSVLLGPEQVFRFTLTRPVANFGVVITRRGKRVRVEPRVVAAGDESRLTGYAALPLYLNPYLTSFGQPVLAAGALRPQPGTYDVVFDSRSAAGAGAFAFRFWVDDTRPPVAKLVGSRVRRGAPILVRVTDAGAGVDPHTASATVDGKEQRTTWARGTLRISTEGLYPGSHRLHVQISDYQESRNTENVPPILPNTRVVDATIVVR